MMPGVIDKAGRTKLPNVFQNHILQVDPFHERLNWALRRPKKESLEVSGWLSGRL